MRNEFKKIAEENSIASNQFLSEFYDGAWKLSQISSKVIDRCMNINEIANDEKKIILLVMLRNCISDICCCLDSLERGHNRTVWNNFRMIFEDFCLILHIHYDEEVFNKFINGNHQASKSVGAAKTLRPNDAKFKSLYGELSKISHHVLPELIARQMVTKEGLISHLKPFNSDKLDIQSNPILFIIDFLRSIGELAEELCLEFLPKPYFWIKPSTRNLATTSDRIILKLIQRAEQIRKELK